MKKAIVTGATGFLGGCLIKELVMKGIETIAVVRSMESNITLLKQLDKVRIVTCSLDDINYLPVLVPDRDVDVFYHFAWAGTSGVERADVNLQINNVKATCDALKVSLEIGCSKFINAGSIMEYEAIQYIPVDGNIPSIGNIYSIGKLTADFMAKALASNIKQNYVSCIISNIYGPGEKSARFINSTIRKFINKEKASFTEGNQLYDFIYITDAVKALYLVGEYGKAFHSYYIGNSVPQPLKSFIIKIRDIVDKEIDLIFGEIPFQGALLKYDEFDTMKLNKEFGFDTEVSFEQGIYMTYQWILKNDYGVRI